MEKPNTNQDLHATPHSDANAPQLQHQDSGHGDGHATSSAEGEAIDLSNYTKALIKSWTQPQKNSQSLSPNKISVSQTVSFLAFIYEKMRNAIEFREDHLIRRAAIERIIKRKMLLNENGRDIAESLIRELLWARYYENNTIDEGAIQVVQEIIDKYFFLRNEAVAGRRGKEQEKINEFILNVLSCEVEDELSPDPKREAYTNYVYQLLRPHIAPISDDSQERDIQVYISIQRTFAHSDDACIRFALLKLMISEITAITWKSADRVLPKFYDAFSNIEKALAHPLAEKINRIIKKQAPPFYILQDIFSQNKGPLEALLSDESTLKQKVDSACRRRYDETKARLRRTGIRSFIYIVLTKVVFAIIAEIPYDKYTTGQIAYIPLGINILFPPLLMAVFILSVTVPGDENTRKIFSQIKSLLSEDPESPESSKYAAIIRKTDPKRSGLFNALFTILYLCAYLVSFGTIIYILTKLNFNPVSQTIFIFFVTLVTFFAFRVVSITKEYLVVDREGPLAPLVDFFFIPIMRVGQWLSGEVLTKFNFFIFIFDFIIEMPLKAIVEVIDEWAHFVRLKKEEIV